MLSSNGRGSNRLDVGRATDAGSNGPLQNISSWGGGGGGGGSRRCVRLFAALSLAALALAAALAAGAVPAYAAPQRAAVTGLSAQPGDNPGELIIAWDAHPDGANDYRVALAPADGEYSHWRDHTWNAYPTDTTVTFSGLVQDAEYQLKVRARFKPKVSGAKRSEWSPAASGAAAGAAETLPAEPTSDDGTSSNSAPSEIGEEKSTSVPDGTEPEPGIVTRDDTPTSTTRGRSPDFPYVLTLRAGNGYTLDPLYEPPPEEATLTFRQNPDYQYSESSFTLTSGSGNKKYFSSFTLTNSASVKIVVSEQEHAGAKLSLYVGQDEHRIVKHAGSQGWSGSQHNVNNRTYTDSILFVDLQPGAYGIRLEQGGTTYNNVTMKLLAIPIEPQSDGGSLEGGIWTTSETGTWITTQEHPDYTAGIGRIASKADLSDVSDWWRFAAIPPVTAATEAGVTHDSVLQITVRSNHGAWFLLWNSDGKSIGYGLATGTVATGYKWASDLLAEEGDVYIEIRPSAAALTQSGNNGYTIHVTRLYEACSSTSGPASPDSQTTLVAWECD